MKDKNVVIAILARDCGTALKRNIPLIEKLRNEFEWSSVVVVENDSKDDTKAILNDWSQSSHDVKIISNDFGTITIPEKTINNPSPTTSLHRIEKMVFYRNMYMDYIRNIDHSVDYLIVIDVDIDEFSVGGVINSIKNAENDWGGIFAYGITKKEFNGNVYSRIFYDIYAVQEYPLTDKIGFTPEILDVRQKTILKIIDDNAFTSVVSAFGGMGIYRYDVVKDFNYCVIRNSENQNESICEHIPFNIGVLKAGYKNYISKELLVIYGDHSFGSILSTKINRKLFKFFFNLFVLLKGEQKK